VLALRASIPSGLSFRVSLAPCQLSISVIMEDPAVKKHIVKLTEEERTELERIAIGKGPAQMRSRAAWCQMDG